MYPRLFRIPLPFTDSSLPINSYGLFIALGFLAALFVIQKESERTGEDPELIKDMAFYMLVAALISSRLFYVLTFPRVFIEDPVEIFRIWNGGLVFYGGFIGALITAFFYLRKKKLDTWKVADIIAPGLAIGHFFGRIGCFFAGCCYGKPCDLPWAVSFTHPETLVPHDLQGVLLHPTQLYSAFNNLAIFVFLWLLRTRKRFDGQVFWIYVMVYGITRSALEILRADDRGGMLFGLFTFSQTTGIILAGFAIVMMVILSRRKRLKDPVSGRE